MSLVRGRDVVKADSGTVHGIETAQPIAPPQASSQSDEPRRSRLMLIGRDLDAGRLEREFKGCLAAGTSEIANLRSWRSLM
jgi:hypothetical protein